MTDESNVHGRIIVSPKAIATIVAQSALQSYGVVGMASKNIVDGIAQALVRDPRHGVQVSTADDQITIDLFIIVEYQTRVSSVAESVANIVHYQVERSLGMPVKAVNVHVQGLRISSRD